MRPCDDHGVRSLDSIERLAQPPERRHIKASERISGVQHKPVQVTCKRQVLIPIVEYQHLSAQSLLGKPSTLKPVFIDDDRYIRKGLREHDRFVPELAHSSAGRWALGSRRLTARPTIRVIKNALASRRPAASSCQYHERISLFFHVTRDVF